MRVKITIDNLIAVALNTTDPSALWAPPLTLGRNFIYICSLVILNWITKRGRLTKIVPKVRGTSNFSCGGGLLKILGQLPYITKNRCDPSHTYFYIYWVCIIKHSRDYSQGEELQPCWNLFVPASST